MNRPTVPTLEDVARAADVSTATVSRCLNTPARVVESTRKRVMEAVDQLGYSPNFGARALAAKRTDTVGAIIPTMENAIFARGIQAFQEELRLHGVTLLVASSSYQSDLEEEQIRTLTARGASALLLIGHHRDPAIYQYLQKRGVPVLVAWAFDPNADALSIGFDNKAAMTALTEKVISMGHRRIGVISADRTSNDRARDRALGIRAAVSAAGLDDESIELVDTTYSIESGAIAFGELMSRKIRPSVIMCGNDVLAIGALKKAKQMGLDVPRDISITGFDDIELATVTDPELTTVHVPHRDMGRKAAKMLVEMINGEDPARSIELVTELRLRGTLATPKI